MGKNNRVREFLEWFFGGCEGKSVFPTSNCQLRKGDYKQELVATFNLAINVLESYIDDETLIHTKISLLDGNIHLKTLRCDLILHFHALGKVPRSDISVMIVDYRVFDVAVKEALDLLLHGLRTNRLFLIFPIEKQLLSLYDKVCRKEILSGSIVFLTRVWMFFKLLHFLVDLSKSERENLGFLAVLVLYTISSIKEARSAIDAPDYIKVFAEEILKVDWKTAKRITESILVKTSKINFCGKPRILRDIEECLQAIIRELEFRLEIYT